MGQYSNGGASGLANETEACPATGEVAQGFGCPGAIIMKADDDLTMIALGPLKQTAALPEAAA